MQPRLVFVKEALRAVPPSDLDHGEDALARRDREHEHSVLHIQQLQAASDGAARAALVDTPKKLWCDHRLCDVAGHDIAVVTSLGI